MSNVEETWLHCKIIVFGNTILRNSLVDSDRRWILCRYTLSGNGESLIVRLVWIHVMVFLCDSTSRFRLWTSEQGILQGTLGKKRQVECLRHRRLATSQPACEALEPEAELHAERWNSTTALLGEVCVTELYWLYRVICCNTSCRGEVAFEWFSDLM